MFAATFCGDGVGLITGLLLLFFLFAGVLEYIQQLATISIAIIGLISSVDGAGIGGLSGRFIGDRLPVCCFGRLILSIAAAGGGS